MEINEFIKERRISLGLSLQTVGDAINYTPQAIRKFESGTVNIDIRLVDQLIKVLNVSLTCLLNADINNIEEYKDVGVFDEEKFIKRLKFIREKEKITQNDISVTLGIARSRVSKIENGESFLNVKEFIKVCEYFKIDYEELYYGVTKVAEINEETKTKILNIRKTKTVTTYLSITLGIFTILFLVTSVMFGINFSRLKEELNHIQSNSGGPGGNTTHKPNEDNNNNNNGEVVNNYHTVTYHFDLSDEIITESVYNGKTARNLAYIHEGYTLIDYYLGSEKFDFNTPIVNDIKITGKLEKKSFNVRFYDYYGTEIYHTTASYLDEVKAPEIKPIADKKFLEWSTDEYLCVKKHLSIYPKYSNVTARAYFNLNGGTFADRKFPKYIDNFTYESLHTLPNILKDGHTFKNFTYNGELFTNTTPLDSVMTLDAEYENNIYEITFNECFLPPIKVRYGEVVNLPTKSADGSREIKKYYSQDYKEYPFSFAYNETTDLILTPVFGGDKISYEKVLGKNEVFLTHFDSFDPTILIPKTIDGFEVSGIKKGAIKDSVHVRKIVAEQSKLFIESGAFSNLPNLEMIDFANLNAESRLQQNVFVDCPSVKYLKVGLGVKENGYQPMRIADYGFKNNGELTLHFGDSVTTIPLEFNKGFGKVKKIIFGKGIVQVSVDHFDCNTLQLEDIEYSTSLRFLNLYIDDYFKPKKLVLHYNLVANIECIGGATPFIDEFVISKGSSAWIRRMDCNKLIVKDHPKVTEFDSMPWIRTSGHIRAKEMICDIIPIISPNGDNTLHGVILPLDETGLNVYLKGVSSVPEDYILNDVFGDENNTFIHFI